MAVPIQVELVHDPNRHRTIVGVTDDPVLLRLTAERLIAEAERRAAQLDGVNDIWALEERAEVARLRRLIAVLFPEDDE